MMGVDWIRLVYCLFLDKVRYIRLRHRVIPLEDCPIRVRISYYFLDNHLENKYLIYIELLGFITRV